MPTPSWIASSTMPIASNSAETAYAEICRPKLDTSLERLTTITACRPLNQGARSSRNPGAQSSRNNGAASSESADNELESLLLVVNLDVAPDERTKIVVGVAAEIVVDPKLVMMFSRSLYRSFVLLPTGLNMTLIRPSAGLPIS